MLIILWTRLIDYDYVAIQCRFTNGYCYIIGPCYDELLYESRIRASGHLFMTNTRLLLH